MVESSVGRIFAFYRYWQVWLLKGVSMLKILMALALIAAVGIGCSYRSLYRNPMEDGSGFGSLDHDGNNHLDQDEFCMAMENVFSLWDTSDNNYLDPDELGAGLFSLFDDDQSGYLTSAEWETLNSETFASRFSFSQWDVNFDNIITPDELSIGLNNNSIAAKWSGGSPSLDRQGFCKMNFFMADIDEDNQISQSEWDGYSQYFR